MKSSFLVALFLFSVVYASSETGGRVLASFSATLGAKNGVPKTTYQFMKVTSSILTGSYRAAMISECRKHHMKPVCDHPSYCKTDSESIYIGQNEHLAYPPHRYDINRAPSGFDQIAKYWVGACSYTNNAHGGYALCNIPANTHSWQTPSSANPGFVCADKEGLARLNKAGEDEVGKGYHNTKDTGEIKSLPDVCKNLCEGDKCRRHCIQSILHGKTRDTLTAEKAKLAARLTAVKTEQASLELTYTSTVKNLAYHTRKTIEWMDAAKKQHLLDLALKNLKKHQGELAQAKADFKKADSSRAAALAKKEEHAAAKKVAHDLLVKADAVKKQTESEIAQENEAILGLEKKLGERKTKLGKLKKLLETTNTEIATHTTTRDNHEKARAEHAKAYERHDEDAKEAQGRVTKSTTDASNGSTDLTKKAKDAKDSHDKAKKGPNEKSFMETDDDFLGAPDDRAFF